MGKAIMYVIIVKEVGEGSMNLEELMRHVGIVMALGE
jgi:hypothetical protein